MVLLSEKMEPPRIRAARSDPSGLILWPLIIMVAWLALYLPNLGVPVFTGMEGLRYTVARETAHHRDWTELYFNGQPYFNKPPLAIWLIAPFVRTVGAIDEFTARLPFALGMLAMGFAIFGTVGRWTGWRQAAIVALLPLTTIGALRFGRSAEIDGIFAVFFILAVLGWSNAWLREDAGRWRGMALTGAALALGGLAKGPLILALFALVVALVLAHGRHLPGRLRRHIPLGALAIGIAVPMLWVALLYMRGVGHAAAAAWTQQIGMRFESGPLSPLVPPHGVQALWGLELTMPWACLFPLLYIPGFLPSAATRNGALLRGGRDAGSAGLLGILAWPGLQYQYLVPISLLMALVLGLAIVAPGHRRRGLFGRLFNLMSISRALAATTVVAAILMLCLTPAISASAPDREIGLEIHAMVPAHETVYSPLSLDNLAAYIGRHVVMAPPETPTGQLYAILRDADLDYLSHETALGMKDLDDFSYPIGWRGQMVALHLVLLTTTRTADTHWSDYLAPIAGS